MTRREREGFLWIIFAAAGFSFTPTLVKLVYQHSSFEPMDIAIWRFLLAVPDHLGAGVVEAAPGVANPRAR